MAGKVVNIFGSKVRRAVENFDGFINQITGMGTARDKAAHTRFRRNRELTGEELDALYSDDAMASRVCDVVPDEELRQGYTVVIDPTEKDNTETGPEDAAQIGVDVKSDADDLGLQEKMIEARVWGRAFGGGAILIGLDDGAAEAGNMAEPIDLNAIRRVTHLNVLDRSYLWPNQFYTDPTEAKAGLPRTYWVTPQSASGVTHARSFQGTIEIHETRLVVFGGARTSIRRRQEQSGWDQSVLQRMQTTLTRYGSSFSALGHLIQDANAGVYKMEGYLEAIAAEETNLVMKRLDMMDMMRSVQRAVVLDAEGEEFERQNFNWSGIKDPFELLMLSLAADARMPVTVLMGQAPAGMQATGESDMRWFYDTITSSQENIIQPALEYVLRLIMLSKEGPTNGVEPESWGVIFPSLWQPTPLEASEIELRHAQSDNIYNAMGAANADEIATSRFTEGGFERTLTINLAERRANLEARSIEGDIEATPTGIVDLQSDIAASRSMTAMQELALQVQSGQITAESAAAIVIASTVGLTFEQALDIVGEPDPVKVAERAAMATALVGGGEAEGAEESEEGDPDPDEGGPEEGDDPEVEENADAAGFAARANAIAGGKVGFRIDSTVMRAVLDSLHNAAEDEERERKRKERERKRKKGVE